MHNGIDKAQIIDKDDDKKACWRVQQVWRLNSLKDSSRSLQDKPHLNAENHCTSPKQLSIDVQGFGKTSQSWGRRKDKLTICHNLKFNYRLFL